MAICGSGRLVSSRPVRSQWIPFKAAKARIGAFVGTLEYEDGLLVAWGYVVEHGNSNSHPQTQGKYHAKQKPNPFNNKNQSTVSNLAAFQPARIPKTKRNEMTCQQMSERKVSKTANPDACVRSHERERSALCKPSTT
ncbi:hypothetical protein QC762_103295 [Podospora pseudocomata]|uniref:Uncharacterized protein n=1 Tax=Podospora pseudocomata TaxID=2093779 RepID=A0ABR0GST5_9PEZI|nr:hypothetical protein QC762_103295 [Podospora pseudocomata]